MLPDRVSNPGPLTYESGALPIALRGPAHIALISLKHLQKKNKKQIIGEETNILHKFCALGLSC